MASCAPLAGRLSQTFSPRSCIFAATLIFSAGTLITSCATGVAVFLLGRATAGVGGAGMATLSIILMIELTTKKRRGLFIGLINAGYTMGVSLGAVIAGALVGPLGWVRYAMASMDHGMDADQG
jgi:MFS family permease